MSIFDPVYRPPRGQHTFLARQQKADRKRKRKEGSLESSDEEGDTNVKSSPLPEEATPRTASTAFNPPVNRTDPYHVAGHSRQDSLPPPPFPHAPLKTRESCVSVEEELAALNPPLYVSKATALNDQSSLKRRHIDNLTTLLHTCMLRGDWQRASRAWGLLLRTEIGGRSVDVRQQGRWGIGAELLMRRDAESTKLEPSIHKGDDEDVDVVSRFSDDGFKTAREYYERLILQYPYTPRTQYNVNALAFYPALFNIWIYEVQDRARRRRRKAGAERPTSSEDSKHSNDVDATGSKTIAAQRQELEEALPIAQRMDELLVSPPYDGSAVLLHLRGMVGLWLADLYAGHTSAPVSDDESSEHSSVGSASGLERNREEALAERERALSCLKRAKGAGADIPVSINVLLNASDAIP
ncbi:hypothetical protein B0A55_10558 [Friedmanniomyces simplex]|uniref:RNA polymerase I-specific transcription initiation factor rrn11 n=1 Tax=Friedmanniomyces simplex TaxID=329884 RepID=A0A4U0WQF7_9PEZI|nr:hypothetical protein B0A55_10558 [Friedmanniomyces simplex]